jgi:hypothetical protein
METKMNPIVEALAPEIMEAELSKIKVLRKTNYLKNLIYVFDGNESPLLMQEVGRLRELSFRMAGGGTGKAFDADEFDYGPYAYQQLIVWDPEEKQISGGYRFKPCWEAKDEEGNYHLSSTEIFIYSEKLKNFYFPETIELGRSFVQPAYQAGNNPRKGAYALDNLWDGLGALVKTYPVKYFFGKITMYTHFSAEARDYILSYLNHIFPDRENLLQIPSKLHIQTNTDSFIESLKGLPYKESHRLLTQKVKEFNESIPPLFNAYMNLSPTMKTFGTSVNEHFGGVEETGIMINIDDIFEEKIKRYVDSF